MGAAMKGRNNYCAIKRFFLYLLSFFFFFWYGAKKEKCTGNQFAPLSSTFLRSEVEGEIRMCPFVRPSLRRIIFENCIPLIA